MAICADEVVNVARVPLRSPFRYPGGKTWFVPTLRRWFVAASAPTPVFVEPFAGGGIISLTVAFEQLADQVIMVELDEEIAAVWTTILGGRAERLAERIVHFELSLERLRSELNVHPRSTERKAFQTILRNRTFRGGILAPGSGMLRGGENGRGIHSRWYPDTLRQRIMDIHQIRERIHFIRGDGLEILRRYQSQRNARFFIDPPYTVAGKRAGKRLYRCSDLDHERLFRLCGELEGDFLMTYDDEPHVRALARHHRFAVKSIPMKTTHHSVTRELVIGRKLSWLR